MKVAQNIKRKSDLFLEVTNACKYILKHDSIALAARDYLDSRLSKEAQDKFSFGFFPANEHIKSLTSLVDKKALEELGIMYPKYMAGSIINHGHFHHHNLVLPFYDDYNNIVSMLGRTLLNSDEQAENKISKYKYSYQANKELYAFGFNAAKEHILKHDFIICVEGQFDYIACKTNGIHNVVALGWANLQRYQFFKLHKYTNNFYLLFDNDEAGRKGVMKAKKRYSAYANIRGINLGSNYKDIDECFRYIREETLNKLGKLYG